MDIDYIIKQLTLNKYIFESLLKNQSKAEYLWKTAPDKWCLKEIICHLVDEEKEDFRARVRHSLYTPNEPLHPINPVGWVLDRNYMGSNYEEKLEEFLLEREHSITFLKTLTNPEWNNAIDHPELGKLSAYLFLSNWLAHDYLHIKQITKLKFDRLKSISSEDLKYAGEWN